jgi:hypothetical protein
MVTLELMSWCRFLEAPEQEQEAPTGTGMLAWLYYFGDGTLRFSMMPGVLCQFGYRASSLSIKFLSECLQGGKRLPTWARNSRKCEAEDISSLGPLSV